MPVATRDIPASTRTTTELFDGSEYTSTVDRARDQDWYRMELDAGVSYVFTMEAARASRLDPYIRVLDSRGRQLDYDDDSGADFDLGNMDSYLEFEAPRTGVFFLSAQGYGSTMGRYTVSMAEFIPDEEEEEDFEEEEDLLKPVGASNFGDVTHVAPLNGGRFPDITAASSSASLVSWQDLSNENTVLAMGS